MAAADGPDPRNLESWEDAFQHPVPAVRGMEKKLRNGVLESEEKLRNLVSMSYRDLLGTARTIVNADKQMQEVEKLLVDVGRRCDSRILDKIAANHARLEGYKASQQSGQYAMASQLWVLQKCLAAIGRLLRTHGSTLLTAKLLVVSRLLHKTLSTLTDASVVSETLGHRLVSLRRKLLKHIDRRFERSYAELPILVEDMTAFSLATSSSPSDVLRHFQHLRLEVIKRPLLDDKENVEASIIKRLQIYLDTQRETRAIYPALLQASLKTLSARTLLEDPDVRAIDELGLDNHLHWIPREVKNFTPWTRHDELQKSKPNQSISPWAKDGFKALMQRLGDDIRLEPDMERLVEMRTELLQMWLSNRHHASGVSSREVLQGMRAQFTSRFNHLIGESFNNLFAKTTLPISDTLQTWTTTHDAAASLWDPSMLSMEISNGASAFRSLVTNQRSGRSASIDQVLNVFDSHVKDAETIQNVIRHMRQVRWEDDYDFSGSDDENEEDTPAHDVLSRDDPRELQRCLGENAVAFAQRLEEFFTADIAAAELDCAAPGAPGLYILRLIRELRRRIPVLLQNIDRDAAQRLICSNFVPRLHASVAASIATKSCKVFATALDTYIDSRLNASSLWEGTSPPLPVQVTMATFKTLRSTVKDMGALGPDVWTSDAVMALRAALGEATGKALADAVVKLDNVSERTPEEPKQLGSNPPDTDTNGVAPHTDTEERERDGAEQDDQIQQIDPEPDTASEAKTEPAVQPSKQTELDGDGDGDGDGDPDLAKAKAKAKAKATQLLFDATYLSHALPGPGPSSGPETQAGNALSAAIASLARIADLNSGVHDASTSMARLNKAAAEYWRRTYLLFGLLSCPV